MSAVHMTGAKPEFSLQQHEKGSRPQQAAAIAAQQLASWCQRQLMHMPT